MTTHILNQENKTLLGLLKKVEQIQEMQRVFNQYVDPNIGAHCKISKVQNNCLIVIVDSGNWATQLRFHIPELLVKLQQHAILQNIQAICCKTRPDTDGMKAKKKPNKRKMQLMSEKTARLILDAVSSIQDEKLREIMERIAGKQTSY